MKKTTDICIVGAAGAGLTAAVRARQLGVQNVLVLEKMKVAGGCSSMSGGIFAVDSPVQKRLGMFCSIDDTFRKLMNVYNWNADAKLVRKWISGSGENLYWLEAFGEEGHIYDIASTHVSDPRKFDHTWHMSTKEKGGLRLVKLLLSNCEKLGVEILTQTRAKHLIKDESERVVGVVAEGPEGEFTVSAKAVILCTGSISSNPDLLRRFYGGDQNEDIRIMANVPHNTGDGLIMAEEVGAASGEISTLLIGPHNHFPGASEHTGMLMRRPHVLFVNRRGERFTDESLTANNDFSWMRCVSLDRQPGRTGYAIIDSELMRITMEHREFEVPRRTLTAMCRPMFLPIEAGDKWRQELIEHMEKEQEAGRAKICGTVEEIAEFTGCPLSSLEQTLADYNHSCEIKHDSEFLKDPDYLYSVKTPPFYVMNAPSGIDTCIGGLRIDSRQRVLDKEYLPIPGLYAAGVLTSGWLAGFYAYFGSEMSYTVFSGRNAAAEAAGFTGHDRKG